MLKVQSGMLKVTPPSLSGAAKRLRSERPRHETSSLTSEITSWRPMTSSNAPSQACRIQVC